MITKQGSSLSEPIPCWSRGKRTVKGPFSDKLYLVMLPTAQTQAELQSWSQ